MPQRACSGAVFLRRRKFLIVITAENLTEIFPEISAGRAREIFDAPLELRCRLISETTGTTTTRVAERLAAREGLAFAPRFELAPDCAAFPLRLIHEYQCLPVVGADASAGTLTLAAGWPPEPRMSEWIYALCGRRPRWIMAAPDMISETIAKRFGVGSGSLDEATLDDLAEEKIEDEEDENAAIIRFVNEIVQKAANDRATDIHFEPQKETLAIRYRIDGELVPVNVPDNLVKFQAAIISRIKIMARLNISERRRPQDGRITFTQQNGETIDIRVSTLPTLYGESVSLRLLGTKAQSLTIGDLGFLPDDEATINAHLRLPHGIILVTGPTGSGKSTSLTAFLRRINTPNLRLMSVEDPVEYEVPGVNQTQVQSEIGLTFANVLRSILRQDPDVVMVGEIRDGETADIAIRAALTGHLVLSTLHTNDAPGALTRLTDMGIEPFLIASSVEMIIAQRLVRRLCLRCSKPAKYDLAYVKSCLVALGLDPALAPEIRTANVPAGCEYCRGIGYRGRVGIFEILPVSEKIHDLIVEKRSASEIREQALREGMRSLQQCGWEQVKRGVTSLEEIMNYAQHAAEER